ncbi:hypothetical protein M2397_000497 [Pseudomonas sp. BIGb0381]|uniref:hypothetical protein n=1 Tax=Pseudomonas sp. BIGb0381 TaxID=2940608 RepID=UPI0021696865|nr:hypothetical protein [Pseudomonas sp. BIGb0381]MCS4310222.1 hypothetical protein [Pseudomonas sp. BIGb0381]
MKLIAAIAMLLMVGQAAGEQLIDVQHDSVRGVTCWILNNTGISCLPDNSFQHQQTASPSHEENRASPASSVQKNALLPATPAPGEERLQL